jgi:hypothetical protein
MPFQPSREVAAQYALRSGGRTFPLPRLVTLDPDDAVTYWDRLGRAGLRCAYGAHPRHGKLEVQYGTAVDIARELGAHLAGAVRAIDALIKGYVREAGGLTPWLRSRAPTFGGVPLCFEPVNRHLERLLFDPDPACRMLLPFLLDPIVTVRNGVPSLGVVEIQTGLGYARLVLLQLEALGFDSTAPTSWMGSVPPLDALSRVGSVFAGGGEVSVLGTFPSATGTLPDEAGWAMYFSPSGLPRGFFLATDLERDAGGWYHLEYEIDPVTGNPVLDAEDRPVRTGRPRERRIEQVVVMQTQRELDELHARFTPRERERFLAFLSDSETVRWIFPHAAWYIADKSLMARIHADLLAAGSPHADLFVASHGPGARVSVPGPYVQKPIRGVGGQGVSDLQVEEGAPVVVPEGFIVQERLTPFPFPLRLPAAFASGFPVPEGAPGAAEHRADPCFTTATVELRIMSMPGSTETRDAYLFMARVAPTWDPGDPAAARVPVLTNLASIQAAVWSSPSVRRDNHGLLPFGWCAVTVGVEEKEPRR